MPRLPWLNKMKNKYNISNDIIDYILSRTNNKHIKNYSIWIKLNNNRLKEIEIELTINYGLL